jgi:hypothetical protein
MHIELLVTRKCLSGLFNRGHEICSYVVARIRERWISGGQTFRDGWQLSYSSPAVEVVVPCRDMELDVAFRVSTTSFNY